MSSRPDQTVDPARRAFLRGRFLSGRSIAAGEQGIAILDRGACMAWNGVICDCCRIACDEQAIALDRRRRPSVVEAECTGCEACVPVCPSDAIRVDG